ncbi:12453_t:CDS:2 [Ambispora gerdemannii]|uniref:12453_t:CDS:1 n=1 Tax=Ambispora gerdemannii TaxID=144530 RepID=A0A9N9B739_9GLOM|nr:12453_t:CDS:2 [Ambispora gerdemannii]
MDNNMVGKRNDDRFREAVLTQNCMINSDDEIIIRKVTSYLIVFLLQWIPMVVHIICVVLNAVGTWNLVLLVLGLSCGGIGNALNFIRNERFNKEVVITDSALSPDTNNQLYYNAPAIIHQDTTGLPANLR